jgi:putative methionine-R-sulfoxide reductase with GAF domain/CHASE3 domain sensor protein
MNLLKSLFAPSIRRRITLAFAFITLLVIGLALGTFFQLSQVRPYSESISDDTALQEYTREIAAQLAALDGDLERYILFQSPEYQEFVRAEMQSLTGALGSLRAGSDPALEPMLAEMEALLPRLQEDVGSLLDESASLSAGNINRLTVRIYADLEMFNTQQRNLSNLLVERIHQTAQKQTQIANLVQAQVLVISIIAGLIAIVIAVVTDFNLRNITRLTAAAAAIAKGDLTKRADIRSRDELGILSNTFNEMASQLQELIGSLEQRVADRTKALATSTEVSRRLSTILNQRQLVFEVVEQIRDAFNYYHAHIYLMDETSGDLIMAGGTGQAGQSMLASGHKVTKGKGLVGRAAETNRAVLVSDVASDPNWLPNPLLPETRSEIAVPISAAGQVLGVLDVQHNVPGGLRQEDADLLQSIASQVAIAMQNARAYEQSQRQAETETLIHTITEKIQRATSIESVLQVAALELSRVTGAKQASVQLGVLEPRVMAKSANHSERQPQTESSQEGLIA